MTIGRAVATREPVRSLPLEGRVALVTGASRGIGRAIARRLAADGARVAVTARDRATLAGTLDEIAAAGAAGLGADLEVRDTGSIRRAVETVEAGLGPIDILVNNAGVQRLRPALELTEEDWDFVLDANLRGAFFMAQAVGRGMVARGYGRIINVASLSAFKALPERAAYNSSKAGLLAVTRSLAVEWGPFGVTANAVAPTFVETELSGLWLNRPGVREGLVAASPIRRLPTADEVAAAVAFLASPDAAAINGTVLGVDGGLGAA
jgi:NAD(P)-dependent dehydrogenase (short-subunit alcohol dehydrogenase family)